MDGLRGTVGEFQFHGGFWRRRSHRRCTTQAGRPRREAEVNRMTFAERNQRQAVTSDIAFDLGLRERALVDPDMCNFAGMREIHHPVSNGDVGGVIDCLA